MAAPEDALVLAQPDPDAQTTVNDFLDYTDFFPSDLLRSLTLIGDLDAAYGEAVQQVHELTSLYGRLPTIPADERPDPPTLRRQIAQQLRKAISLREYAAAEASRLYEVARRHCERSAVITRKLQAQPEPPSRDPTPPPVSPNAQRTLARSYERPAHLRFYNTGALPHRRRRSHGRSGSDMSDSDSDIRSTIDMTTTPRKHKGQRDRHAKPVRVRPAGVLGTNVHSAVAGISTSNALAQLAPPPPDAKRGSKHAPWKKLTEYEMAVLRKQMKKNAVWVPSATMIRRELERKGRTEEDYEREKARCEETGEKLLEEEPDASQVVVIPEPWTSPVATSAYPPGEARSVDGKDGKDGKRIDRLSQRQQAMRDAQELEKATRKLGAAATTLKELRFASHEVGTPSSQKGSSSSQPNNKRKRETSAELTEDDTGDYTRHSSPESQATSSGQPQVKRQRLQLIAPAPLPHNSLTNTPASTTLSISLDFSTPLARSPTSEVPSTEQPAVEVKSSTMQIPLAPAGPTAPKLSVKAGSKDPSPRTLVFPTSLGDQKSSPSSATHPQSLNSALAVVTAASSRPRRESVIVKTSSPPAAQTHFSKSSKTSTPAPDAPSEATGSGTRPRSARSHVPTPKAQSEEPKIAESSRAIREARRHSVFGQTADTPPTTRTSGRRKAPPKGEVTTAEDGKKTVTNVKRVRGSKNKASTKKKTEEEAEQQEEIDPDEERYCICDDISYGPMISCDNNCDKQWFHLPCVNMAEADIPARRARWFCPDCRAALRIDAFGNPLVPPPLPGRRGNRLGSA